MARVSQKSKLQQFKKTRRKRKKSYEKNIKPYLEEIRELLYKGATNKEIAEISDISEQTLIKWRREHEELGALFDDVDLKTKLSEDLYNALYERALGKTVEETTEVIAEGGLLVSRTVMTKYIYSDKAADMYARNVLGSRATDNEITINFVHGDEPVNLKINTGGNGDDDEGDFEISR